MSSLRIPDFKSGSINRMEKKFPVMSQRTRLPSGLQFGIKRGKFKKKAIGKTT